MLKECVKNFTGIMLALSFLTGVAQADEPVFDRVMKTKTINCGYFVWPPYIAKDPNTGKLSGINYDLMEAIGRNLQLKINWAAEIDTGDTVTGLNTNKADMMCISLWPSPARTENLTFTAPEFYDVVYAYVRSDDKRFDGNLEKANTKDIKTAGIDGDTTADLAMEKLPNATPQFLPQSASGAEALMYVVSRKADIVFIDDASVNDFAKNNPDKLRKVAGIGPARVFSEHLALKSGEYHLRDILNVSLQQLSNDGVIKKITDRYTKEYHSLFMAPSQSFALSSN